MEEDAILEQELLARISVDQVKSIIQSVYEEIAKEVEVSCCLSNRRSLISLFTLSSLYIVITIVVTTNNQSLTSSRYSTKIMSPSFTNGPQIAKLIN